MSVQVSPSWNEKQLNLYQIKIFYSKKKKKNMGVNAVIFIPHQNFQEVI